VCAIMEIRTKNNDHVVKRTSRSLKIFDVFKKRTHRCKSVDSQLPTKTQTELMETVPAPLYLANNRDIHLLALEELKQRPEFQHPDKLFEKAMIPDPDYSDSDEDENSDSCKMSPQPNRVSTTTSANVNGHTTTSEDGLVLPRKVNNPCLDSKEKQNLHRELLFNQKIGKNVLGQKSELKKVMDKFQEEQKKKELEVEKLNNRTSLEKKLEEQALKLKMVEEQRAINEKTVEELEPQSEFHRIHAKLRAKVELQ